MSQPSKKKALSPKKKDPALRGTCERCHRPWKSILASGARHGVFEMEGTEYTFHVVGRGVTEQRCIGLKNPEGISFTHIGIEATKHHVYGLQNEASIMNRERHSRTLYMPVASAFRSYLAAEESKAKMILHEAGYQIEPGENAPPLSKQEVLRRTINSLEHEGLCEFISKEWYAAKILTVIYKLLDAIDFSSNLENMLVLAAELGGFIREAEIRFGVVASQARKGGEAKKGIPEVRKLVSSLLRKNPRATSTALWRMIPREEFDALKAGSLKVYISEGRLQSLRKVAGEWQLGLSVSFAAFRRYVTAARKVLAR